MKCFHYTEIDSTQTEAFRLLSQGELPPFYVTTDYQSEGKGRRNRDWIFEKNASMAFSLCLEIPSHQLEALSLLVGYALWKTIGIEEFRLKWPNDLMKEEDKVGGILIQSRSQADRAEVVIGVGLNWRNLPSGAYKGIESFENVSQMPVLADFVANLERELSSLLQTKFSSHRENLESILWKRFESVRFEVNDSTESVEIIGLDERGRLRLKSGSKLILALDGEILWEEGSS